jgi:hypothetical protein
MHSLAGIGRGSSEEPLQAVCRKGAKENFGFLFSSQPEAYQVPLLHGAPRAQRKQGIALGGGIQGDKIRDAT